MTFWLEFDKRRFNFLIGPSERYFVWERGETLAILSVRCPHRGGPIHLGSVTAEGGIRCPWHGRVSNSECLSQRSLPYIARGPVVTVGLAGEPHEWSLHRRPTVKLEPWSRP